MSLKTDGEVLAFAADEGKKMLDRAEAAEKKVKKLKEIIYYTRSNLKLVRAAYEQGMSHELRKWLIVTDEYLVDAMITQDIGPDSIPGELMDGEEERLKELQRKNGLLIGLACERLLREMMEKGHEISIRWVKGEGWQTQWSLVGQTLAYQSGSCADLAAALIKTRDRAYSVLREREEEMRIQANKIKAFLESTDKE
jgi:hypothetical protein